ncbi:MAG TPA: YsnF/AvaK domain-containing protein [Bacillus sp. (in: firmicutes)]|nr:YsnF/AvaK domain-containing protein [Bacillus sp. (in: firmicutes)]
MTKQVVGVYDSEDSVIAAIEDLKSKGYDYDDMSIVSNNEENRDFLEYRTDASVHDVTTDMSLAEKIKSAFIGDESNSLEEKLVDIGVSRVDATSYASEVDSGKILLMVDSVSNNNYDSSNDHLSDTTGIIEGERYSTDGIGYNNQLNDDGVEEKSIHLKEEQLNVDKEEVKAGEVKVRKEVIEEQEKLHVPVKHEEIFVEHRSVSKDGVEANPIENDETIRVPVYEEQVEVTKKPVITDEIVIGKRTVEETQQVADSVKKEKAYIEREGNPIVEGDSKLGDSLKDREG